MTASTIGLMVPTRGRPALLERFAKSIVQTANDPSRIEIHTYLDRDDAALDEYAATIERLSAELGPLGISFAGGIGDPRWRVPMVRPKFCTDCPPGAWRRQSQYRACALIVFRIEATLASEGPALTTRGGGGGGCGVEVDRLLTSNLGR